MCTHDDEVGAFHASRAEEALTGRPLKEPSFCVRRLRPRSGKRGLGLGHDLLMHSRCRPTGVDRDRDIGNRGEDEATIGLDQSSRLPDRHQTLGRSLYAANDSFEYHPASQ
jgi:hypothetical protein